LLTGRRRLGKKGRQTSLAGWVRDLILLLLPRDVGYVVRLRDLEIILRVETHSAKSIAQIPFEVSGNDDRRDGYLPVPVPISCRHSESALLHT